MTTRFILIGGFLGAGKTTAIARLASMHAALGQQVAIVTNDKAPALVDTWNLSAQGYQVAELAGTCFCGNIDQLIEAVEGFRLTRMPDVILAEPVGSCLDLVATVVRPLADRKVGAYEVAPLAVLLKPSHGLRILSGTPNLGFSPKAAYLFRKQIEEADFVALNRIDQLSPSEIEDLSGLLVREYPETPVVRISARTGAGFDEFLRRLSEPRASNGRRLDVDYEAYAAGEAELAWLNAGLILRAPQPLAVDACLVEFAKSLRSRLSAGGLEIAHIKVLGSGDGRSSVVNLIGNEPPAEMSRASGATANSVHLTINARVAGDPEQLSAIVRHCVDELCGPRGIEVSWHQLRSFRPGRPEGHSPLALLTAKDGDRSAGDSTRPAP
jgi:Ni2+-binding GTPase involved in maturation of urease and hydrogenase